MAAVLKPGWSKPSTILFAAEIPTNEKTFGFALAQAAEFGADLIIFHAYDRVGPDAKTPLGGHRNDYSLARGERHFLEPFAERARNAGIHCKILVREGQPADELLAFLRDRGTIDRVIMGAHSPGPIGKLLVGSVAEAVLRNSEVPVCIVGPNAVEGTWRYPVARRILCDVSKREVSQVVAYLGAEVAAADKACLLLQLVVAPQDRAEALGVRSINEVEAELHSLVPARLQNYIRVQARAVLGDPTEELLYGGRAQKASLILLGAQGASHFAAHTRAGAIYKVLAYAHCPVMTLSPVLLAGCGAKPPMPHPREINYLAGVV
jgi:nucleotide-binding universal stress UspA family protein